MSDRAEIIETMARAYAARTWKSAPDDVGETWRWYVDDMEAALTALQAEGMTVVPVVSEEPGRRLEIAVEAAAQWLISDDSAYEQSPEDAHRVAREMLRVANEAYQGIRMVTMETKGEA